MSYALLNVEPCYLSAQLRVLVSLHLGGNLLESLGYVLAFVQFGEESLATGIR